MKLAVIHREYPEDRISKPKLTPLSVRPTVGALLNI